MLMIFSHINFQETPTKELGDHSSGSDSQVPEFSSPVSTASYLNRFTNSESSTDEEGKTKTHQTYTAAEKNRPFVTHFAESSQVVASSGTMTSPPLHLLSSRRATKTQYLRPRPRLQHLASPLHLLPPGACWSPAGPPPQTTPVSPSRPPASLASP